jgi:hypothetical protein
VPYADLDPAMRAQMTRPGYRATRKVFGCNQRDHHDRRGNPPDAPAPAGRPVFVPTDSVFHRRTAQPTPILYDDNPGAGC